MKTSVAIALVTLVLASFGCGGEGDGVGTTTEAKAPVTSATPTEAQASAERQRTEKRASGESGNGQEGKAASSRPEPKIVPPNGPPPKRLVVKDIRVGSGPLAQHGDEVAVFYTSINYDSGQPTYTRWPPLSDPWVMQLGRGGSGDGFEKGIEGMRVGGRRQLIIPPNLGFDGKTIVYVVDLVQVGPTAEKSGAG